MTSSRLFESLSSRIPSATTPQDTERVREFITHVSTISTEGIYNSVLILAQDLKATAPCSDHDWHEFGRAIKPNAPALVVNRIGGPAALVYDFRHTVSHNSDLFHGLPPHRYSLGEMAALERLHKEMSNSGFGPQRGTEEMTALIDSQHGAYVEYFGAQSLGYDSNGKVVWPLIYGFSSLGVDESLSVEEKFQVQLGQYLYALCLATTTYRVPWLQHAEDEFATNPDMESLRRSHELRNYGSNDARELEASLATLILSSRYGWNLNAPVAQEFLRKSDYLAPEGTNLITMLQAVHFVEVTLRAHVNPILR